MMKRFAFVLPCLALAAAAPSLAELRYVPIPNVGSGTIKILAEYQRQTDAPKNVDITRIAEGVSGTTVQPVRAQVYTGPSTKKLFPLLNITPSTSGLIILNAEPGLSSNEVSLEAGKAPTNGAWELPLLSDASDFNPNTTAFVLNLTKSGADTSNLSIFNLGPAAATCSFKVLRPVGTTIEERTGINVPAVGAVRFDDVLRRITGNGKANASVTCNQPFYALGALPSADRTKVRVFYPVRELRPAGTPVTLASRTGTFLTVAPENPVAHFVLPLEKSTTPGAAGPRYRSIKIDFDVRTSDPEGFSVLRGIVGLFRSGGRRFNTTLFFGSYDRLDSTGGPRILIDPGTPYIETTVKRALDFSGVNFLHFQIELNTETRTITYLVRNSDGVTKMNLVMGLFNEDLNAVGDAQPLLELGLPGVADDAYFPPYGWKFSRLTVVGIK